MEIGRQKDYLLPMIPQEILQEARRDADEHLRDVIKTRVESPGTLLAILWARFIKSFYGKEVFDEIMKKDK
jgi:hypothetical protein